VQEGFTKMAGARVVRCEAGDEPLFSWMESLVDVIEGVAERAVQEL
jgi:Zn ribbon nucleic-acid-binding protein